VEPFKPYRRPPRGCNRPPDAAAINHASEKPCESGAPSALRLEQHHVAKWSTICMEIGSSRRITADTETADVARIDCSIEKFQ
jgi:hypothetical protein